MQTGFVLRRTSAMAGMLLWAVAIVDEAGKAVEDEGQAEVVGVTGIVVAALSSAGCCADAGSRG